MLSCIMKTRDARDKVLTAAKLLFYKMKHWWRYVHSFRNIVTKKISILSRLKNTKWLFMPTTAASLVMNFSLFLFRRLLTS